MKTLGLRVGVQAPRLRAQEYNADGSRKAWVKRPDAPDAHRLRGRAGMERRARWLHAHPLCVDCLPSGRVTAGTVVDHKVPLSEGGRDDHSNLQTLCTSHHDAKSERERRVRTGGAV